MEKIPDDVTEDVLEDADQEPEPEAPEVPSTPPAAGRPKNVMGRPKNEPPVSGALGALAGGRLQAMHRPVVDTSAAGQRRAKPLPMPAQAPPAPPAPERPRRPAPAPAAPEEAVMAEKAPRYWVRWVNPASGVFKYFGVDYDHGQLVPLRPGPTYDKLLNIMYVALVDTPRLIAPCGVCGAEFLNERFLNAHGAKRHSDRFATTEDLEVHAAMQTEHGDAAAVDVTGDALERRLMSEFPLALENTTASRAG